MAESSSKPSPIDPFTPDSSAMIPGNGDVTSFLKNVPVIEPVTESATEEYEGPDTQPDVVDDWQEDVEAVLAIQSLSELDVEISDEEIPDVEDVDVLDDEPDLSEIDGFSDFLEQYQEPEEPGLSDMTTTTVNDDPLATALSASMDSHMARNSSSLDDGEDADTTETVAGITLPDFGADDDVLPETFEIDRTDCPFPTETDLAETVESIPLDSGEVMSPESVMAPEVYAPEIELDDDGIDDLDMDPRDAPSRSRFSFSSNPIFKTIGVSLASLGVVLVLFVGWKVSTSQGNLPKSANIAESQAESDELVDPVQRNTEELGQTKAQLAVSEQTEANASFMNRNAGSEVDGDGSDSDIDEDDSTDASTDPSTSTSQPQSEPQPVVVSRPPTPASTPSPVRTVPASSIQPAPPIQPATPIAPPPAPYGSDLSPVEQWQLVAQIGAFGGATPSSFQSVPRQIPTTPPQPTAPSLFQPETVIPPTAPAPSFSSTAPAPSFSSPSGGTQDISQLRNSSTVPGLRQTAMASVLIGEAAGGALDTDIILASDGTTNTNPNDPQAPKYLITLHESILDVNDAVAIPSGAKIVSAVSNFSPGSGVVQLVAKSILHDGVEYSLPEGAVLVQAKDGGHMTAKARNNASLSRTIVPALLDGVAAAGDALNEDTSSIVSNGSSSITTTDSQSNIPAAALGGVASSLADSMKRQAEEANQRASQRDEVWFLRAGDDVKLVVNATIQM